MRRPRHQTVRLTVGRHRCAESGMCVMELASVLAGERFSDRPRAVSPTIADLLRGYNDGLDDARRQSLKRLASECVGTSDGRSAERRRRLLLRRAFPVAAGPGVPLPRWLQQSAGADPYHAARNLGRSVAATNDDALHARALAVIDELVAVTAPAAIRESIPSADVSDDAHAALTGPRRAR